MILKVNYRPIEEKDIEYLYKWLNNPDFTSFFYRDLPINYHKIKIMIQHELNRDIPMFFIQYVDEPIGYFSLNDVDFINRKSEITLGIAEQEFRGKGLGKDMLHHILHYSFYRLNLEQVYLYVYNNNPDAKELYESLGFIKEGEIRILKYLAGKPVSGIRYSLFKSEYREDQSK